MVWLPCSWPLTWGWQSLDPTHHHEHPATNISTCSTGGSRQSSHQSRFSFNLNFPIGKLLTFCHNLWTPCLVSSVSPFVTCWEIMEKAAVSVWEYYPYVDAMTTHKHTPQVYIKIIREDHRTALKALSTNYLGQDHKSKVHKPFLLAVP